MSLCNERRQDRQALEAEGPEVDLDQYRGVVRCCSDGKETFDKQRKEEEVAMKNRSLLVTVGAFLSILSVPASALAGGGPEDIVVVVNASSWSSKSIANKYCQLKGIDASHVISLTSLAKIRDIHSVSVDEFRELILKPTLSEIEKRGLKDQIDYLVYSSDIPYHINVAGDANGSTMQKFDRTNSLTGLTYLYESVLTKSLGSYVGLNTNYYYRGIDRSGPQPSSKDRLAAQRAQKLLSKDKKYEAAIKAYEALIKKYPSSTNLLYNCACAYALAGKAKAAMGKLELAHKHGWTNAAHMRKDPDLKILYPRRDFKELATKMDSGSKNKSLRIADSKAFNSRLYWLRNATTERSKSSNGRRYLLSTILGYTSGRGNSVEEVWSYLERSHSAHESQPKGTVYIMKNNDVRSRTRAWAFQPLVKALAKVGVKAEILEGVLPPNKKDVLGAIIGRANFDWEKSGSQILPGAICEHLTSFGGILKQFKSQTPLSAHLRHGAAGASGTVVEPYAIQQKFPSPFIQLHYARGSSLAEAYYQSVAGPYQLLIVGDPLCAPFARPPRFALKSPEDKALLSNTVSIETSLAADSPSAKWFALFVDGKKVSEVKATETLKLNPAQFSSGYHSVRVVAIGEEPIRSQSEQRIGVFIGNRSTLKVKCSKRQFDWREKVRISLNKGAPGALSIRHQHRTIGKIAKGQRRAWIPARSLGLGPIEIQLVDEKGRFVSAPLSFEVIQSHRKALRRAPKGLKPGLLIRFDRKKPTVIKSFDKSSAKKAKGQKKWALQGYFKVEKKGIYQLFVRGAVTVQINGKNLFKGTTSGWERFPLSLESGLHRFDFNGSLKNRLPQLLFGRKQVYTLGRQFKAAKEF
jgi:tetratricopeptide (TPR) repeat protein